MNDGMIIDCNREQYDAIEAVNFSTLKAMAESPAAYRRLVSQPRKDSDTFAFGRLTHTLTFEPEKVDREWVVWDGKRRAGKEWEQFQADNAGKEILRAQDLEPASAISDAVRSHPAVARWLATGQAEVSLVWTDPETGIKCKGRIDWLAPGIVADLKSTKAPHPRPFAASVVSYHYHAQAAMYLDALMLSGQSPRRYGLIAVGKSAPHKVRAYPLASLAVERGREVYRGWLRMLAECQARDEWPAWLPGEDEETELDLPAYGYDDEDDEIDLEGVAA